MADGGVWARLPQPNNGGGIWTKTSSGWVEIGGGGGSDGLEGLGGWAEITEVTGSPKRYAYNDGTTDWVAFEWTDDGSVTLAGTGNILADIFMISAGGMRSSDSGGAGGRTVYGVLQFTAGPQTVTVGTGRDGGHGNESVFGPYRTYLSPANGGGAGGTAGANADAPMTSSVTGTPQTYGQSGYDGYGSTGTPRPNRGDGSPRNTDGGGSNGVVIVRVPAAQAAGVDPGSWVTRIDYYAEVTDGIVTDTYQERFYGDDTVRTENGRYASPEQPDDLIPCDPTVAEGWTYAEGEFTPPPPDPSWREEAIKALQEQLKDLQKDT